MADTDKPKRRPSIPLWLTISLSAMGALAVAVAAQVWRYASGTALILWWVACGVVIVANLVLAPIRQWLSEQNAKISLNVAPKHETSVPDSRAQDKILAGWTANMRASLLKSLDEYDPDREEQEGRDFVRMGRDGTGAKIMLPQEERTPDQYKAEVERYLVEGQAFLREVMAANYALNRYGELPLVAIGGNEGTLEGVRIRLWTDHPDANLFDPEEVDHPKEVPNQPAPYGQPMRRRVRKPNLLDTLAASRQADLNDYLDPLIQRHPEGGVIFPDLELRRDEKEPLPKIALSYRGEPGKTLTFKWSATSKNAPGIATGSFTVRVRKHDISQDALLAHPKFGKTPAG